MSSTEPEIGPNSSSEASTSRSFTRPQPTTGTSNESGIPSKTRKLDHGAKKGHEEVVKKVLSISENVTIQQGFPVDIDVIPDTRPFCVITARWIVNSFKTLDISNSDILSPASLLAYSLFCYYGLHYLHDISKIEKTSAAAAYLESEPYYKTLHQTLENLNVLPIHHDVFASCSPFSPPLCNKVVFTPSLYTYLPYCDAGRVLPVSLFILAHNNALNCFRDPPNAHLSWYMMPILTTLAGNHHRVGNILGTLYINNNNQLRYIDNPLSTELKPFADSTTIRSMTRRSVYSNIIFEPETDVPMAMNPYTHLMCIGRLNFAEIRSVMTHISTILEEQVSNVRKLSSFIDPGTHAIVRHSIKSFTVPMCNAQIFPDHDDPKTIPKGTGREFINAIQVGVDLPIRPRSPLNDEDNTGDSQTPSALSTRPTRSTSKNKISKEKKTRSKSQDTNSEGKYPHISLDEVDTSPYVSTKFPEFEEAEMLLFDPYDNNASQHYTTVFSGRIIENQDIDAAATYLENPSIPLSHNRSSHLNACFPVTWIIPEYSEQEKPIYQRVPPPDRYGKTAHAFLDMGIVSYPVYNPGAVPPGILPPLDLFTQQEGLELTDPCTNWFTHGSFRRTPIHRDRHAHLWSSYRYTIDRTAERDPGSLYFMSSLRPMFGSLTGLVECTPFYSLISR